MSKGLEAITSPVSTELRNGKQYYTYTKEDVDIAEKELKSLEIIKNHLSEQVANIKSDKSQKCLLMLIMENDEGYDLLKEVLL